MALFIIGLVLSIAGLGFLIYKTFKFSKENFNNSEEKIVIDKNMNLFFLILVIGVGITTILSSIGLAIFRQYNLNIFEKLLLGFGSLLFGSGAAATCSSFVLYYWCPNISKKYKKFSRIITFAGFAITIIGLWIFSEGIANQNIYPLINGINFSTGFTHPFEFSSGFQIKFYGVIIVCGALVCYFYCDHQTYHKFGSHGLVDTVFIFAFLMGIIGARLWSCFVLEPAYFLKNPLAVITEINRGGLAIQGGALLGIISGVSFILIFRKYMDIRYVMDIAVPTILLAQAIGRWGNFFNQEVYGFVTTREALWYLPTIVKNNMYIAGDYRVPLFFIESIVNICGYFLIRYFFGKVCKFKIGLGYQASCYCIWYGLVRVFMEPLRNSEFEYNQSIITAYAMIVIGLACFAVMFFVHKKRMSLGLEDSNGEKIKKVNV